MDFSKVRNKLSRLKNKRTKITDFKKQGDKNYILVYYFYQNIFLYRLYYLYEI